MYIVFGLKSMESVYEGNEHLLAAAASFMYVDCSNNQSKEDVIN